MTYYQVQDVTLIVKEGVDIRATRRKMRGFNLGHTTSTINERSEKTNETMVADTAKVLKFGA